LLLLLLAPFVPHPIGDWTGLDCLRLSFATAPVTLDPPISSARNNDALELAGFSVQLVSRSNLLLFGRAYPTRSCSVVLVVVVVIIGIGI
jgi:hypothetical protein